MTSSVRPEIRIGIRPLRIEDVDALARGDAEPSLDPDPDFREFLLSGPKFLEQFLSQDGNVYGVTTGFGDSCVVTIPEEQIRALPMNLVRFHGCGTGPLLDHHLSSAVVIVRLATLARGYSGVRPETLSLMVDLVRHQIAPCIPSRGSVGASGDLTPLSYVAAVLAGEREVMWQGEIHSASDALRACGLQPVVLGPKESLALMNGTTMMTGLGCDAFIRSQRLARLACSLTAMASDAIVGNAAHFNDRLFELKPHPGMRTAAHWIREDLAASSGDVEPSRLQDRYSIRCAPQVIGVLLDALPLFRQLLETELNGASDNPLIDPDTEQILHGGNFYGGHIAFMLDSLKNLVANIADLLERQLILLCQADCSNGLPTNLVGVHGPSAAAHHGFKAMQITASALTAEALKLTMPASVFSRSTENHNQDKVSMGSIAAHDTETILDLTETVAVIALLAMVQAVELRGLKYCGARSHAIHSAVRAHVPFLDEDRRQDLDIATVLAEFRANRLPIGAISSEYLMLV